MARTVHKIAFRARLPLLAPQSGTLPMVIAESSAADEKELVARFGKEYRLAQAKIIREIERKVCGCDYVGTSWTIRHESRQAGELLQSGPGKRLLEVGAGSGWAGLYLAGTTGCDVILVVSVSKIHPPPSGEFSGPTVPTPPENLSGPQGFGGLPFRRNNARTALQS